MNSQIGKRHHIDNLRLIWPREGDFSDWLTTQDGLSLITEDIGVTLEDPKRESRPGDFPCDIVGHAVGDENHVIVIENQFGKTNHDHLGKLLTYTAMHSAFTGIWLAEEVSEDHRKVIDWLNDNTPSNVSFYLAQVKAYRIDGSNPAPQLDIVSRPNFLAKRHRNEINDSDLLCKQLWDDVFAYVTHKNPPFRVQSPGYRIYLNIPVGRAGFKFYWWLGLPPKHQSISCGLYITVNWKDRAFAQLYEQKESIEHEIGEPLEWLTDQKWANIFLNANIDPQLDENREKVKEWMYTKAMALWKAFHGRVLNLSSSSSFNEGASLIEEDNLLDDVEEPGETDPVASKCRVPNTQQSEEAVALAQSCRPSLRSRESLSQTPGTL